MIAMNEWLAVAAGILLLAAAAAAAGWRLSVSRAAGL
jgi:hypothetical protein